MSKLIENTTVAAIELADMGITIPASSTYEIGDLGGDIIELSDDLETNIQSGDIKLIESEGPTVYYSATQASRILRRKIDSVLASGGSGELLCSSPTGDLVWTPVVGGTIVFFSDGVNSNKWMKIVEASGRTSDLTPHVFLFDAVVYGISFVNHLDSRVSDIEFYKNGTLLFTWSIVTKRWAYKTNGLSSLTFSAGDRLSIFMSDAGADPNDPILTLYFSFLNANQAEGGAAIGV